MISKSLSTSERYARLSTVAGKLAEFCQAMYPLLVAHSDDFGRLPGDVHTVKHLIVPSSQRKSDEIAKALEALHVVRLIQLYDASDNRKVIQITNFDEHQPGLHKRTKSRLPEPPSGGSGSGDAGPISESPGNSRKLPEIPPELKGTEEKGIEGKRTERTEQQDSGADAASAPPANGDEWRGNRSRQPAADANWKVSVALAHDVIAGCGGCINADDPDLADLMREALSKRHITYDHEPDLPRRALACAMTQRLRKRLADMPSASGRPS